MFIGHNPIKPKKKEKSAQQKVIIERTMEASKLITDAALSFKDAGDAVMTMKESFAEFATTLPKETLWQKIKRKILYLFRK